jgi:autotransporter-associated beta strand protein
MNQSAGTVSSVYQIWINYNAKQNVNYAISGGTMSLNAPASNLSAYGLTLGNACGNYTCTFTLKTGGTVNIGTAASNNYGYLAIVGGNGDGCGVLDVQGGTLTVGTGQATNKLYFFRDGANSGKTATMTQSGGAVTAQGIQFGGDDASKTYNGAASAAMRLTGGDLYVGSLGITRVSAAAALPVTIQLAGGTVGASADWSSSLDMKLGTSGGGVTFRAADSGGTGRNVTLSGILSDDDAVQGGFTKTGAGTLTLTGANSYSGETIVSAGTLQIGDGGATGSIDNASAVTNDAALVYNRSDPVSVGYAISGTGTLTQKGAGALTLTDANYTGQTAVNAGTLVLDYTTQSNSKLSDSAALVLGGGTLDLKGGSHTEVVASTTLTAGTASAVTSSTKGSVLKMGAITRDAGATINFGAAGIATTDNTNTPNGILGAWATVGGTDWAVNSTNDANGPITACTGYTDVPRLTPGTIANDSATNVRLVEGSGSAGDIKLGEPTTTINTLNQSAGGGGSGATIDPAAQTLLTNAILVGSGAGGLTIGAGTDNGTLIAAAAGGDLLLINNTANALTVNSVIADNSTSTLTKAGDGTATLAGENTYAGGTTVSAGTLGLTGSLTGGGAIILKGTGVLSEGATGVISGATSITHSSTGTSILSGANSYTGGTTLAAGTLQLGNAGALGAGTLTFSGGNLDSAVADLVNAGNNAQAWNADFTFVGTQSLNLGTGGVTMNGNRQVTVTANTLKVGGGISGAFGLTKAGAGTLVLGGANTYTGPTTISGGTLTLGPGGRLTAGNYAGAISIAGGSVLSYANGATQTLTGVISGAGTLSQDSGGDLILSGAGNTFRNLTVTGGRVFISNTWALPSGATSTIGNLGILDFGAGGNNFSGAITVLSGGGIAMRVSAGMTLSNVTLPGSGTVIFNNDDATTYLLTISRSQAISTGGTLTVQVGGNRVGANPLGAVTLSGAISGSGSLTKTGAGTLNLSGNNAYAGDTTISEGVLTINQPYLDDASTVTISVTGGLNLAFADSSVVDTVGDLWLGATQATPGTTYNSGNGLGYITGTGNMKVAAIAGDTNGDNVVDAADYLAVKQNLGLTTGATLGQGNLDGDGDVDWDDLQLVMTNFGAGSGTTPATTPEPATLGLLAVGALAVIRRRRRS